MCSFRRQALVPESINLALIDIAGPQRIISIMIAKELQAQFVDVSYCPCK